MFNHSNLAFAQPGTELLSISRHLADLYLTEYAPVDCDVIYSESMPLRRPEGISLFKAGINIFYPTAHRTRNHDRRIPGGILISINSPGHYANSLVMRGIAPTLDSAVAEIMQLTLRSIGNGGIGHDPTRSASWHNIEDDPDALASRCPFRGLPAFVPADHSRQTYSALYHTDVLVPTNVTADSALDKTSDEVEQWHNLRIDYITTEAYPQDDVNYGLFHGHPVPEEARYCNPWLPRRAANSAHE